MRFPLNPLIDLLQCRVEKLGNKIRVLEGNPPDFTFSSMEAENVLRSLSVFPTDITIKLIKTWVNSWATSARYRNKEMFTFPCLLCGFAAGDSVEHFLACGCSWDTILNVTGDLPILNIHNRLAILPGDTNIYNIRNVVLLFIGYHSIKHFRTTFAPDSINHDSVKAHFLGTLSSWFNSRMLSAIPSMYSDVSSIG